MKTLLQATVKHIEFLTPTNEARGSEVYTELLKRAIKDESVKNIALAGPYGSGKSSILKRFAKESAKDRIVEISLANFEDVGEGLKKRENDEEEGTVRSVKEDIQTKVEKSLLQQLFFSVYKSEIPHSKLKRIVEPRRWKLVLLVLAVISWIATGFLLTNPDICELHISIANRTVILTAIFLFLSVVLLYLLFVYLSKVKLNKLVIQNNEFDLSSEDQDTSLINRHIDEIIYFFEKTKHDILIIEDLDRFSCKEIFEKLRELNTIINNTKSIKKRGKVTFIYAIKDDFFLGENRTKFFDLIIPVIPFINATGNARQIFLKKLREAGHKEVIDEDLLRYISYRVHDYRLLANIFNEYLLYYYQLCPNTKEREIKDKSVFEPAGRFATKLLAMIFYKNLFPGDFSALHRSEGVLYTLFSQGKQELIKKRSEQLEKSIDENRKAIKEIENETAENLAELRMLCLKKLFGQYPDIPHINLNGKTVGLIRIANDELLFRNLLETLQKPHSQIYIGSRNISQRNIDDFATIVAECKERTERFREHKEAEIDKLQKSIEQHETEKIRIRGVVFRKLIEETDGRQIAERLLEENIVKETVKEHKGVIQKETILFLIQNGFIDENYRSIISYFHEGGDLSRTDNEYILDVMNQKEPQLGRKIDNVEAVVRELSPALLATRYALNDTVVCTLFSDRNKSNDVKRHAVVKLLAEEERSAKEFLPYFIKTAPTECAARLIGALAKEDDGFWDKSVFLGIGDETMLALLLKGTENEALLAQGGPLARSLSECKTLPLLMGRYNLDRETIEALLQQLDVKFPDLEIFSGNEENRKFLRFVYDHDLYALNVRMIELMVRNLGTFEKGERPDEERALEYGVIKESGLQRLVKRVDEHIDDYVEAYLHHLPSGERFLDKKSLLLLLNHEHLSQAWIETIVSNMDTVIDSLVELDRCDAMHAVVFQAKFLPTWKNVIHYFAHCADNQLDDALRSCLCDEHFVDALLRENPPEPDRERGLFNTLAEIMMFDDHFPMPCLMRFKGCFESLDHITFEITATEPSRINALVDEKFLLNLPDVYRVLSEYDEHADSDTHLHLLASDFTLTLELLPEISIDERDAVWLLESSNFSLKEKIALIAPLFERVGPENLAISIAEVILDAIERNESLRLPIRILCVILQSELTYDKKKIIFEDQIQRIEAPKDAISLLKAMGEEFSKLIPGEKGSRTVHIPDSETNEATLNALHRLGIIGKFHRKKNGSVFTVYRRNHLPEA